MTATISVSLFRRWLGWTNSTRESWSLFHRHGGSFFGDQSVFVRHETFRALGGFAPLPLMEDMEFFRRLRRAGKWWCSIRRLSPHPGGIHVADHGAPQLRTASAFSSTNADSRRPGCTVGITATALPRLTIQSSPRSRSKNSAGVETSRSDWRVASRLSRRASEPTQTR